MGGHLLDKRHYLNHALNKVQWVQLLGILNVVAAGNMLTWPGSQRASCLWKWRKQEVEICAAFLSGLWHISCWGGWQSPRDKSRLQPTTTEPQHPSADTLVIPQLSCFLSGQICFCCLVTLSKDASSNIKPYLPFSANLPNLFIPMLL